MNDSSNPGVPEVTDPAFQLVVRVALPLAQVAELLDVVVSTAPGAVEWLPRLVAGVEATAVLAADGETRLSWLADRVAQVLGADLLACTDVVILAAQSGKIHMAATVLLVTLDDLAVAYTPGVGRIARFIAADPHRAHDPTGRDNRVAIVVLAALQNALRLVGKELATARIVLMAPAPRAPPSPACC